MRISLSELEQARRDPRAYVRQREGRGGGFFFKSGYATLQRAVFRFHQSKGNLEEAKKYLQESYERQFKHRQKLEGYIEQLERYTLEFANRGNRVFKVRDRLVIPVPEELANQVSVTGQIPRLDFVPSGGYNVWLFAKQPVDWRAELRLPLIQAAYSKKLTAGLNEVKVGVYDFSTATYTDYSFDEQEVTEANHELVDLLQQVTAISSRNTLGHI
jgi:hypothetical protein